MGRRGISYVKKMEAVEKYERGEGSLVEALPHSLLGCSIFNVDILDKSCFLESETSFIPIC